MDVGFLNRVPDRFRTAIRLMVISQNISRKISPVQ